MTTDNLNPLVPSTFETLEDLEATLIVADKADINHIVHDIVRKLWPDAGFRALHDPFKGKAVVINSVLIAQRIQQYAKTQLIAVVDEASLEDVIRAHGVVSRRYKWMAAKKRAEHAKAMLNDDSREAAE